MTDQISYDPSTFPKKPTTALDHIPGDTGWPVIGDTLRFLTDLRGLSDEKFAKYGRICRASALLQQTVILFGPEANELVLKDPKKRFSNKLAWDLLLDRLFPNGLMLRDFDDHRFHRRIMQEAFKRSALQGYLEPMNPLLASGLDAWPTGQTVRFQEVVKALLLDVAAAVFLGVELGNEAAGINRAFVDAVEASISVVKIPGRWTAWGRGLRGRAKLESFIEAHIADKRASEGPDFFSQICRAKDEDGQVFTDEAVRDHVIFLLFAAHDTTTSTLCSIAYCLAKHPEWQAKVRAELTASGKESLDYDDLESLEVTELVFREALRMYPPLASINRRTTRPTTIFGYDIPANTAISISPLHTHYMEEYWTTPDRFDPERFSPERAEHRQHLFQWIPFGGGAHKCIGINFAELQVKLALFHLLRRFEIHVPDGYTMPVRSVPLSFPSDGLPVEFRTITP